MLMILRLLAVFALICSVAWFIAEAHYEQGIAVISSLLTLLGLWFGEERFKARSSQKQKVAQGGIALQTGDVVAHNFNQILNVAPSAVDISDDAVQRQNDARKVLAPELQRTIERVLYIHGRANSNFVSASVKSDFKSTDKKQDFIPYWPTLYPSAHHVRDLSENDAAALVAFYDSLHSLNDHVIDWWDREGQLPVNLFNSFLHDASKSLKRALVCIESFGLEKHFPPEYESWGTISHRIKQSLNFEDKARQHHIDRFNAKAEKEKMARNPTSLRLR